MTKRIKILSAVALVLLGALALAYMNRSTIIIAAVGFAQRTAFATAPNQPVTWQDGGRWQGSGDQPPNIVGFPDGEVVHPDTGEKVDAQALLDSYYLPFAGKILARAGYPAFTALVQGGYIEAWGAAANPGWHAAGVMRYRSRRDLLASVNDPAFNDIHIYKRVALAATFAIPAKSIGGMLLSPRVWVALLIFAFAALVHITNLTVRKTNDR